MTSMRQNKVKHHNKSFKKSGVVKHLSAYQRFNLRPVGMELHEHGNLLLPCSAPQMYD